MISTMKMNQEMYEFFQKAFVFFNDKLFSGELPEAIITIQKKNRAAGFHLHDSFTSRVDKDKHISEIACNPLSFVGKDDIEALQTLVHEMVHLWEYFVTDGNPSRPGYHNRMWAEKMISIGLMPSSTGEVGGKTTGQKMSDYVLDGGQFEIHAGAFLLSNSLPLESTVFASKEKASPKKTRDKYVCPECLQNAWAKKSARLACANHDEPVIMIVEEG